MNDQVIRWQAEWVFPVAGPPIRDGVVEVTQGVITAVHGKRDSSAHRLPGIAIIPGLVNAHTHLEFSSLTEPLQPASPFPDWLRAVIRWRRTGTHDFAASVLEGQTQSRDVGTTTLGEIASAGWKAESIDPQGPRVVAFQEVLGLRPERRVQMQVEAARFLQHAPETPHLVRGLSPHAPYSVHPDLFSDLVKLAELRRVPLAMHLAETIDEVELLQTGGGRFVRFLEELGVWDPTAIPRGSRAMDYLREFERLSRGLVVHGNFLNAEEQQYLAEHENLSVVYCPRTHAFFGHAEHPWRSLLEREVRIAVGTDSRASNPDLSVWEELQFLRRKFPDVAAETLLRMGTKFGADALGLGDDCGTLEPGKRADFTFVKLAAETGFDPYGELFAAGSVPVRTPS